MSDIQMELQKRLLLPDYALKSFFQSEEYLHRDYAHLLESLAKMEEQLESFHNVKSLICNEGTDFEEELLQFLKERLGLLVEKDNSNKETFWILNSQKERRIVCMSRCYNENLKKSGIYSLYNQREAFNLNEDFPAIFIAHCYVDDTDWVTKAQPISTKDYKVAADNNILILRVADVLYLWEALQYNRITQNEMIDLLITEKGWLGLDYSGAYHIYNQDTDDELGQAGARFAEGMGMTYSLRNQLLTRISKWTQKNSSAFIHARQIPYREKKEQLPVS